uniref:Olfactory receptor n=1 Tax=Sciurus vulgaris TaxID=55149 RepID=A0A8D2B983_SCIVU
MPEKFTNVTSITEFLLMRFPDDKVLQRLCAMLFFLIYLAALIGNLLIITLTTIDQHLQSPMYFFLKNLSFIDICYISVTVPKSIIKSLINIHSISFLGCASQVFFVIFLAGTEIFLLLVMSYDRYAAICQPLHYETIMNRYACVQMVIISWFSGCVYGSLHVAGKFTAHFCGTIIVHQLFCDIPSLLMVSCSRNNILEYILIIVSCCFAFLCFISMVVSYVYIFTTVLRIPYAKSRFKIFSTCLPHLTVVTLFLFSGFIAYLLSYSLLPPSLNPVIYSLRNRDMKVALNNIFGGKMIPNFILQYFK